LISSFLSRLLARIVRLLAPKASPEPPFESGTYDDGDTWA